VAPSGSGVLDRVGLPLTKPWTCSTTFTSLDQRGFVLPLNIEQAGPKGVL
jgi:hypothetical protein